MYTRSLILEIITEELPPKKLSDIEQTFKNSICSTFSEKNVLNKNCIVTSYSTPRRIALHFSSIFNKSPSIIKTDRMMPKKIGLTEDNKPTETLIKKLKLRKIDDYQNKIKIEFDKGQEYIVIENILPGIDIKEIIQEAFTTAVDILANKYQSMKYQLEDEISTVKFIRPARNILALFGDDKLDIFALGLHSANKTIGHRFMNNNFINLIHADHYEETLEKYGFVIPSYSKRKKYILDQLLSNAEKIGYDLEETENLENLLDEVTATVEYPSVYLGEFDKTFLDLPQECLILTMRSHQKYFPLFEKNTFKLTNKFLIVSNITSKNIENIINGNQKVIHPRLSDAKFFYETDKVVPLENRLLKLGSVVYHNKIGSQIERIERLRIISKYLAEKLGADIITADRIALLSKADLESLMVSEFPELQGIIGSYYAKSHGESEIIVEALKEQYLNKFEKPITKDNILSSILFLSERIEKIVGMFAVKIYPTGESDPFGLRRAAIGIISVFEKMIEGNFLKEDYSNVISIKDLFDKTLSLFKNIEINSEISYKAVDFIYDRYKNQLINYYDRDIVEGVLVKKPPLHLVITIIKSLISFKETSEYTKLIAMNKRISNFLKKKTLLLNNFDPILIDNEFEKILFMEIKDIEPQLEELSLSGEFKKYLTLITSLNSKVNNFLNNVTIMTDDKIVCHNRLILLRKIKRMINNFVDITYITHENNNS